MNRTARVSSGLLDRIVETKVVEVAALRPRASDLHGQAHATPQPPDFAAAVRGGAGGAVRLIAEVKRRSPSAGAIRESVDPVATAMEYAAGGAAAISVLTDAEYFGGSIADLGAVSGAVTVPVLRKDFIIDELQIVEARSAGAAAVLLIVRLLDEHALRDLREAAESLGMAALVEAHDEAELDVALSSGATIIGINNRNLDTLEIDLGTSTNLIPRIPPSHTAVAESGVRGAAEVELFAAAGADAVLVGESLMRQSGPRAGATALSRIPRVGRA